MNWKSMTRNVAVAIACATFPGALLAQNTKTVETGETLVTLSSTLVDALSSLDVTPGVVAPTHLNDGVVSFPVTGGGLDPDTAKGNILHSGGLTFSAKGVVVKIQDFVIDTAGKEPQITALVIISNRVYGRITVFDLALPSGVTLPLSPAKGGFNLDLPGVGVTLDGALASFLNGAYDVKAFAAGIPVGTAEVDAFIDPTS